jgi:hypothetical protein
MGGKKVELTLLLRREKQEQMENPKQDMTTPLTTSDDQLGTSFFLYLCVIMH